MLEQVVFRVAYVYARQDLGLFKHNSNHYARVQFPDNL